MFYNQVQRGHPVECRCILEELRTGVYTPPEAYRALCAEHEQPRWRREETERLDALTRIDAERQAWLRAGAQL